MKILASEEMQESRDLVQHGSSAWMPKSWGDRGPGSTRGLKLMHPREGRMPWRPRFKLSKPTFSSVRRR